MELRDRVAVVTGGASGIGKALAERFRREGARHVVVADRDRAGAEAVAKSIEGRGVGLDVADEPAVRALVEETLASHGAIDLFVSNAGFASGGGLEVSNESFQRNWDVHVMAHVYAARAVLPSMIARGEGYLLNTSSAAGLLAQIGSVTYSVTKHAAVALAEWIAITHGHQGIRVSVLCPQLVETSIFENSPDRDELAGGPNAAARDGAIQPEDCADSVIEALAEERFHVLPHAEVAAYVKQKGDDVDRWLAGMQRWQERLYRGRPQPGEALVD